MNIPNRNKKNIVSTYVVVDVVVQSVNHSVTRVLVEKVEDMPDMPDMLFVASLGVGEGMSMSMMVARGRSNAQWR